MYNAALNAFSQFLADDQGVFLEQDLDAIFADETTTETEKKNLVSTRIGQGQFRKDLIDYWNCLLYTSPSPRDLSTSRMPSSA